MAVLSPKWIQKRLIENHIWVSLNCAALAFATQWAFENRIFLGRILGLFFITLAGYHFYRLIPYRNAKRFLTQNSMFWMLLSLLGLSSLVFFFPSEFSPSKGQYFLMLSFMSGIYYLPGTGMGVRKIPYFKLFYISIIWSLWINLWVLNYFNIYGFLAVFCMVVALTIPFDIRDLWQNEKTLPQLVGVKYSRIISIFFMTLSLFFWLTTAFSLSIIIAFILLFMVFNGLLFMVNRFKSDDYDSFYISFIIESIPLILALALGLVIH